MAVQIVKMMQLIIGMENLTHHIYTSYLHQAILLL